MTGTDGLITSQRAEQSGIRLFAFVIAVGVGVLLSAGFEVPWLWRCGESGEITAERRINPNDAPVGSLVRLPGIGIGKANSIVAYREGVVGQGRGGRAFEDCQDLQKVRGIGPKTAESVCAYLKFDGEQVNAAMVLKCR